MYEFELRVFIASKTNINVSVTRKTKGAGILENYLKSQLLLNELQTNYYQIQKTVKQFQREWTIFKVQFWAVCN